MLERGGTRGRAEDFVVVDAKDGDFLRHGDSAHVRRIEDFARAHVAHGEDGAGLGQGLQPGSEVGPAAEDRAVQAPFAEGGRKALPAQLAPRGLPLGADEGEVPEAAGEEVRRSRPPLGDMVADDGGDARAARGLPRLRLVFDQDGRQTEAEKRAPFGLALDVGDDAVKPDAARLRRRALDVSADAELEVPAGARLVARVLKHAVELEALGVVARRNDDKDVLDSHSENKSVV